MWKLILVMCLTSVIKLQGQNFNSDISQLIEETNLDSLISYVRILSGEDSAKIGAEKYLIKGRRLLSTNDLAADYIKEKLISFNFGVIDQAYSNTGRNIYSVQTGNKFPNEYYIYCAHYDSETDYCADDNASGVAGVLEAARILSNHQFDYSIIYAFWDEEEIGALGSKHFVRNAITEELNIKGVINFEMSGWDQNNDGMVDVHTKNIGNSVFLSNTMVRVDSLYNLPTDPVVYNPGTNGSDHYFFWKENISAICFSEAYYGGDFNPYYHTAQDRIDKFNLPYFHNVSKLGLGVIATLATEGDLTSINDNKNELPTLNISNYPNPFNSSTNIDYELEEECYYEISLFNSIGQMIKVLDKGEKQRGKYSINLDGNNLSSGIYLLKITTSNDFKYHKMILLK